MMGEKNDDRGREGGREGGRDKWCKISNNKGVTTYKFFGNLICLVMAVWLRRERHRIITHKEILVSVQIYVKGVVKGWPEGGRAAYNIPHHLTCKMM